VKRFHGLGFNAKLENPHGARIENAFTTDGDPLADDRIYRAAYITEQGGPERYGNGRQSLSIQTLMPCGAGSAPLIVTTATSADCGFADPARRHIDSIWPPEQSVDRHGKDETLDQDATACH
jgi:hypothetical protein